MIKTELSIDEEQAIRGEGIVHVRPRRPTCSYKSNFSAVTIQRHSALITKAMCNIARGGPVGYRHIIG